MSDLWALKGLTEEGQAWCYRSSLICCYPGNWHGCASDETMHLVLETLQAMVKAGHEAALSIEPVISPIILNMWALHVSDPFISIDALDVLEAIKNAPGCVHPLVLRVLPYVGPILNEPQQQPDGLVAGSLDLLTMLLKNAPTDVVKAIYEVCFDPVVRTVLQSDDHGEMQNATQCLAALISGGKQEMLTWSGDPSFAMRCLLDVASRWASRSIFRKLGITFCWELYFATYSTSFFTNGTTYKRPLQLSTGEIQGAYQIKVTTTALALMLSTRHVEFGNINVQGHLIKSSAGITTRSKAKLSPDQWTLMPLPAKIIAILADVLLEIQEQVLEADEQDSDWEEVEAGDAELEQDLLSSAGTTSYSRPSHGYLDAMAKAFNEVYTTNTTFGIK
ncbi:ARM repeat superfamily protein [Artemisia annua]|uniref:ARM repeat superfamily protein n=1 Tax=Artemisia annua TaxID=35608 RepID=A0A2U1PC46_ARTAN|nr:ARM repeat superfamily protein [Artemisia annua]